MDKYFYVVIEENVGRTPTPFIIQHIKVMCAKSEEAVVENVRKRYGKQLVEFTVEELAEDDPMLYEEPIYIVS